MRKLTVAVDVDSTIFDILNPTLRRVNRTLGTNYTVKDVTFWHFFGEIVPYETFITCLREATLADELKPIEEDIQISIRRIAEKHHVYFLSAVDEMRYPSMRKALDSIGFSDIELVRSDKSKIEYQWDVLIDDSPIYKLPAGDKRLIINYPQAYNFGNVNMREISNLLTCDGVAISGKNRSGKDTLAAGLIGNSRTFYRIGQADSLKIDAARALGKPDDYFFQEDNKIKHRKFLIDYGAAFRQYDEDWWVKRTAKRIANSFGAPIVSDVRFQNELRFWQAIGFTAIRLEASKAVIEARGGQWLDDPSETSLDEAIGWDAVIGVDALNKDEVLDSALMVIQSE